MRFTQLKDVLAATDNEGAARAKAAMRESAPTSSSPAVLGGTHRATAMRKNDAQLFGDERIVDFNGERQSLKRHRTAPQDARACVLVHPKPKLPRTVHVEDGYDPQSRDEAAQRLDAPGPIGDDNVGDAERRWGVERRV